MQTVQQKYLEICVAVSITELVRKILQPRQGSAAEDHFPFSLLHKNWFDLISLFMYMQQTQMVMVMA